MNDSGGAGRPARPRWPLPDPIEGVDAIFWEADPATWQVSFVSPRAEEILGYPIEQWLSTPDFWVNLVHPEDREQAATLCAAAVEQGGDHEHEYRVVAADGRVVWLHELVHVVRGADGRAVQLRGLMVDITRQKQAAEALEARVRQQAAVVELGQRALAGTGLPALMDEAVALVARTLEVDCTNVLEVLPGGDRLLLRAGVGWAEGLVGCATVGAGRDSLAGYTLLCREPVIVEDWRTETRFSAPTLYQGKRLTSGVTVIIHEEGRPFGVLGAHTVRRRTFTRDDIHFLQAIAHVLAAAILRRRAEEERERLVAALEAERGRLEAVLRQMPAGVIIAEAPSGKYTLYNDQVEQIFGRPFRPAAGIEHYAQYPGFHPDGRPYCPEEWPLARAIRAGEVVAAEEIGFVRGDGSRGTLRVSAAPIRDRDGRIVAGAVTLYDITPQKRTEDTIRFLAEASRQLAASLDHEATLATVARLAVTSFADYCIVYLVEPDQSIRRASIAHRDPAKEALAQMLQQHAPPDRNGPHPVAVALRTGRPELVSDATDAWLTLATDTAEHLAILRALGPRSYLAVPLVARRRVIGAISFVATEPGRHYGPADVALAEDLAQRAALAVDNARLYREAQAAAADAREAVRAREAFLARASHELRTPLTSALGTVRLLKKATAGLVNESPDTLIDIASRNLTAMAALVNELLDASKLAAGRETLAIEPVELGLVAADSLQIVGSQARERGVRLRSAVPVGLKLPADRLKLGQVLVNLLSNGIKFTPSGGEVLIEAEAAGGSLLLRVRDTGEGIAREHLEAIFEPFFQVPRPDRPQHGDRRTARGRSSGLGLAICRGLVELHGGRIWAESEGPGRGSTFTIQLPMRGTAERAA